ncbi:armadillo-like helical protein [Vibrio phage 1.081.O._10N.286.52.C2]|nr:armadillo-like helical protein [Vibrio phage 1.081.O._10N.286.52.C2]
MKKRFSEFYAEVEETQIFEVSDRSNVPITWHDPLNATFSAGGEKVAVSLDDDQDGEFTIMFSNNGSYSQSGQSKGAAAIFSGVLTTLREFTETYEEEVGLKPYQYTFSAAYELPMGHPHKRDIISLSVGNSTLSLDEKKAVFKDLISRPMLYYALSLTFGASYGYKTDMNDIYLLKLAGGANDFRSVRRNVNKSIADLSEDQMDRLFVSMKGSVHFKLTNASTSSSDYDGAYMDSELSLEDNIDDASDEQLEDWINAGREADIIEYAGWQTLVRIAGMEYMHSNLITHSDKDVRDAVIQSDPDMVDELIDSEHPEMRAHAAEYGAGIEKLITDDEEEVRDAAWDYATENYDFDQRIPLMKYVIRNGDEEQIDAMAEWVIDYGHWQERLFLAEEGRNIEKLMIDASEEVRQGAINSVFSQMGFEGEEAASYISDVSANTDYSQENFEYAMEGNFGSDFEDKLLELARDEMLDVSKYSPDEDEDEDEDDIYS